MTKLNEKQEKALAIFNETGDSEKALTEAGYNKRYIKSGKSFLDNIAVKDEENPSALSAVNAMGDILNYLTRVMKGEEVDATATQRLKAAEMLSKHYGLDKEKLQENGTLPVVVHDDI